MSSVSDLYSKMIDLFQDESKWTQKYYHRDSKGEMCGWQDPDLQSYCALGALHALAAEDNNLVHMAQCCLQRVSEHMFNEVIQGVNDNKGLPDVLKALNYAKELWSEQDPKPEHLSMTIPELLAARKTK